jgi:hypothetical protein
LVMDLVRTPFKIIVNVSVPETAIASCDVWGGRGAAPARHAMALSWIRPLG